MADSVLPEQELKIVKLDSRYSTTRRLSKIKPILENNPAGKIKTELFSSSQNPGMIHGGLRCSGYFKYTCPEHLLITVITVVYNGDNHLEQTIQSVINQTYYNIEYIIIDGGSTDNTLNIIKKYQGMIDYWISEPDNGIADAMNKGISFSTGEYIVFIHSDDYFFSSKVIDAAKININKQYEIVMHPVLFGQKHYEIKPRQFNWWVNFKIPACHQGILCKLNLFRSIGVFDCQYKIDMDYDFLLRAYRRGVLVQRSTSVLSVMRDTGISSRKDMKSIFERLSEERNVHRKNCQNILMEAIYKIYWFFYLFYKKLSLYLK